MSRVLARACCTFYLLVLLTQLLLGQDQKLPEQKFRAYPLPDDVRSADISPDDRFIAVDVVERPNVSLGNFVDTNRIEVRDFRANRQVATLTLGSKELLRSPTSNRIIGGIQSATVRYSPDGQSLLVWFKPALYVLRATDLKIVSKFELEPPPAWLVRPAGKGEPSLTAIEASRDNGRAIALWGFARQHAISTYEITTGAQLHSWLLPEAFFYSAFVEDDDGQSVLFVTGDVLCSPHPGPNGIFRLNMGTGAIESVEATATLPSVPALLSGSSIAFTVKKSCFREKPRPEFVVYDTSTNAARYRGETQYATGWVLSAPESHRMVAYSGDWKRVFDWGDWTGWYYTPGRQTFTVWNSQTLEPLARSQNLPGLFACTVRISRSGRYIVTAGWHRQKGGYAVYELP
jgi:hypothetical protein